MVGANANYPQVGLRQSGPSPHYYYVAVRNTTQAIPGGQWWLAAWKRDPAEDSPAHAGRVANAIREGCLHGRYWLRAYAVLPARVALLLYPLGDAEELLRYFDSLAGGIPEKLRAIHNDAELERAAHYVESLPVRSHLAARPEDYPLSSVGWMRALSAPASSRPTGPAPLSRSSLRPAWPDR